MLDTFMLSRIQFAANISFHILFPAITIGLAWLLFYLKVRHDMSHAPVWMRAYRFWVKIFALTFAVGVVSGITMSFQFGTNWPGFLETVGNVAAPLLGYEVLTAFFLEATFLGVMLFGINRVPNWLHTLATFLVAFGTSLSAFWIIALNSWMQTPAGFEMREGIAYPLSWMEVIFNPSMPYRLIHMLLASGLTASFLVAGLSAYRILKGDPKHAPRLALKTGIVAAAIMIPIQIIVGDLHGLNTLEHQPAKVAAMEALWETREGAPLVLFALPDEEQRTNRFSLEVPKLASLILTHTWDGQVQGLNDFPEEHPPVAPVFWAFRVMVGLGFIMLFVAWAALFQILRQGELSRGMLRMVFAMTFSGWVALLAGWYVTEIGRQPWIVTDVLLTRDVVTQLPAGNIWFSLTAYILLYVVLLTAYLGTLFYMARQSVEVEEYDDMSIAAQRNIAEGHPGVQGRS
ncbi:cytochrome ubiquinol oxidase subunit I [Gilvimarinus sp. F26214L]|uniref:cytochrome ubiquinol oxidase subunit I n=1 Tax=Gilvimarinus sp. DZF01 TaxID=3461371 RepID=UPI00404658C9